MDRPEVMAGPGYRPLDHDDNSPCCLPPTLYTSPYVPLPTLCRSSKSSWGLRLDISNDAAAHIVYVWSIGFMGNCINSMKINKKYLWKKISFSRIFGNFRSCAVNFGLLDWKSVALLCIWCDGPHWNQFKSTKIKMGSKTEDLMKLDLYKILGVQSDATDKEVIKIILRL